jgi:Co/Zn/Cd efflux system component
MDNIVMERMTFRVPQMDCTAEEQLVRMKLADYPEVKSLSFDLPARTVVLTHSGSGLAIERAMETLKMGASVVEREGVEEQGEEADLNASDERQRKFLMIVLVINAALFLLELITGFFAHSMGLVADSLDMLADTLVYGLSLYAVGKTVMRKKQVARMSGYFQLCLAVFGVIEVLRRITSEGDEPSFTLMIGISLIALIGNAASLLVLQRAQSRDVHMKASWIFTTNDVLVNIGVIIAGVLVFLSGSKAPDLVTGAIVFCLVGSGAYRILRLSR